MRTLDYVKWIAKSLVAAGTAFAGGMAIGYVEGGLSQAELWLAIASGLTAGGAVLGVKNGDKPVRVTDEEIEEFLGH